MKQCTKSSKSLGGFLVNFLKPKILPSFHLHQRAFYYLNSFLNKNEAEIFTEPRFFSSF